MQSACCDVVQAERHDPRVRTKTTSRPSPPKSGPSHRFFWLASSTGHHVISRSSFHGWFPRLQFNPIASPTHRHPSEYPPPPQHHRTLRPLSTEQYLHPRGSVQRYSHRRVAAHACGISARLQELSTAPKTWKCRLLAPPRPARRGERGPGSWEGAVLFPRMEEIAASCQRHGSCVWRRRFAGRAGTSCHFYQSSVVSLSVPVACDLCSKSQGCSARSLGGRESCFAAGVTISVMLFAVALILTCYRFERSDGHGR